MIRELSEIEVKALHYELLLKDIISTAEKLPPFPDVAWKVMALIKKVAPVKEIEEVIKLDPVITAKLLSVSQSVYYGRKYAVSSLQDSILLLGNQRLIQIIMAVCASRYFEGKVSGHKLHERELWEHSVSTALLSEIVCRRLKNKRVLTVYTAALLHDIGKTVLDIYAKIYLRTSLRQISGEDRSISAERKALGIDHQELGGIIARRWRLPAEIATAIEFHHCPHRAPEHQSVAAMVYIANELATTFAKSPVQDGAQPCGPEDDPILRKFGITGEMAESFRAECQEGMEMVRKTLAP